MFGCCKQDADCNDDNACTADKCGKSNGACTNTYVGGPNCCANDADCADGDDCTLDRCVGGKCGHDVSCCKLAKDCGKAGALGLCAEVTCTAKGCGAWPSASGTGGTCCSPDVAKTGFEDTDKLAFKMVPGSWGSWKIATTPGSAKTGTAGLVFRGAAKLIPGGGTYARAISAPIKLPAAVQSRLRFYFQAKQGPSYPREYFRVRIRTSAGEWIA